MYEAFFHLRETPFSIAPNPHYLYMSQQHNEALAHLIYGVGRDGGFVLLTGEVGTGKTTVCRCFLEQVPEATDVAFVLNPKLKVDELLATICDELSIPYIGDSISLKDYVDCINGFLLRQHAEGRHTVLIIDEAQNLSSDVLEQIRLLTNLETHEKKLLQIVLLGQPELQEMFRQPELRQLSQRVTARFHLNALNEDEVGPYVYHRLNIAGAVDPRSMFPPATIKRLFQISSGIPRIINLVCDRAMLGAYSKETRVVSAEILSNAAREVLGHQVYAPIRSMARLPWQPALIGGLVALLLMVSIGISFWLGSNSNSEVVADSEPAQDSATNTDQVPQQAANQIGSYAGPVVVPDQPVTMTSEAMLTTAESAPSPLVLAPAAALPANQSVGEKDASLNFSEVFAQAEHGSDGGAYVDLFSAWGFDYDPVSDGMACNHAERLGLSCLNKLGSLGSIRHYGLPAIVRLFGPDGSDKYVVMRHLDEQVAEVFLGGSVKKVSLDGLDEYWRGHYSLLWKKPPAYHGPMHPGTIAPLSKWLAYQLDVWENKSDPSLGRSTYDPELVERVREFQRRVGEVDDGVVGSGTLIQLTRRVDESIPLLNPINEGS